MKTTLALLLLSLAPLGAFAQTVYTNLAELVAKVNPSTLRAGAVMTTMGFYSPGDGGNATYRFVAGSSLTNLPNKPAPGGAYEIVGWNGDVRACGARPVTTTNAWDWVRYRIGAVVPPDSSDGLQAACDAVETGKFGNRLHNPKGIYRVTRTIRLRAPYGVILTGEGGISATQDANNIGLQTQAAQSEWIRDFASGPLFWMTGSTNATDPYRTNLQVGFSFNNYIELMGFGDRFTSTGTGYASAPDFINISPLVKLSGAVRTHTRLVRFSRTHGSHLDLYKVDDSHFWQCYFDSSSIYTNTWSTLGHGTTIITNASPGVNETYDAINTIHFEDCTWEVSNGGSVNFTATSGNIGGFKLEGCVLKTPFVYTNNNSGKPNLVLNHVLDGVVDTFLSGYKSFASGFTSPVFVTNQVEIANCSGLTLNLRLQNIADGLVAVVSNLVYLTNSTEIRLGLHSKSTLTNLLGDVVRVDPSCYNIQFIGPVQDWNTHARRFSNIPLRDFNGVSTWIGNGEVGMWGSTSSDALAVTTMPIALGTNDFTYYARVKLPSKPPADLDKYLGGISDFSTNVLAGNNTVRFYITSAGEMVFRQAGSNFPPAIIVTSGFNLWNIKANEWVDLAWVRSSGAAGSVAMYANGRRSVTANASLAENNYATNFLHMVDNTNGVSLAQWDGAIGTCGLIQQVLSAEEIYRLPIDGPPDPTRLKWWYVWDTDGVGWDRSTNNNHAGMFNGAGTRYGRGNRSMTAAYAARLTSVPAGQPFFLSDIGAQAFNSGGLLYSNVAINNGNAFFGGDGPYWQVNSTTNVGLLMNVTGTTGAVLRIRNADTPIFTLNTNSVVAGGTNTVLFLWDGTTNRRVLVAPDLASVPTNGRVLYFSP